MTKNFICANCGCDIIGDVYICQDNFLQLKYFENNKLNRFCSQTCFCEYLMLEVLDEEDIPLDEDELDSNTVNIDVEFDENLGDIL